MDKKPTPAFLVRWFETRKRSFMPTAQMLNSRLVQAPESVRHVFMAVRIRQRGSETV